ncbi:MAG: hypothetical protein V1739_03440 [Candidatus Omnitrophota bacterium]
MIRGLVFLLVSGVLFSVSGCTMSEVMGVQKEKPVRYESKPNLSAKENHDLKTWLNAAETADEVGDYKMAILYYTKIMNYFPDTKEGGLAQKRLKEINGKPSLAEGKKSL